MYYNKKEINLTKEAFLSNPIIMISVLILTIISFFNSKNISLCNEINPNIKTESVIIKEVLTTASYNKNFAKKVCSLFNNEYFQVNTSLDVIGCEICSAFKNALALISGILDNELFDKNAKAAFITFGIKEMQKILLLFKTNPDTSINLAGLGDLIVTAFNNNSRNYKAGRQISLGKTLKEIYKNNNQVIEGIDNLKVFYKLSKIKNIELPIIHSSFQVIFKKKPIKKIINTIFNKIKFY